jgi:hypothetical protein
MRDRTSNMRQVDYRITRDPYTFCYPVNWLDISTCCTWTPVTLYTSPSQLSMLTPASYESIHIELVRLIHATLVEFHTSALITINILRTVWQYAEYVRLPPSKDQIIDFLSGRKIITKTEHAFIKQHSTYTNLLQSTQDWLVSLNSRLCTDVIYIVFFRKRSTR